MGNAPSAPNKKKPTAWEWEYKNGRMQVKPRAPGAAPKRSLLRKQPSDNYNWWIFNPDPPKKSLSRGGSKSRR